MPPDWSGDFDFTKRGLLVFADKSVAAGSVCIPRSSPEPRASTFSPNLGVNEFNAIIQKMAKVRLSGSVNQTRMPNLFLHAFFKKTFSNKHVCCVSWSMMPSKPLREQSY